MATQTPQALFSPILLGPLSLKHRVVMAPLTRSRSTHPGDIPNDLMAEYYGQRASDGGLIITEATSISPSARGWFGAPGLYSSQQVEGWKKVIASVRAKGGHIFAQLWHTGRSSNIETSGSMPVAPSVDPSYWQDDSHLVSGPKGWVKPSPHRALQIDEIHGIIVDYGKAAQRAKDAGFDGVELHGGNGYLPAQFLQDGSNQRTDAYGGSIENRSRFFLEAVEAIASVWGGNRTAARIAPGGIWNSMSDSNPEALYGYLVDQLNRFDLAYINIIEPRVKGNIVLEEGQQPVAAMQLRKIFKNKIIASGGFEPDTAEEVVAAGHADLVAFGRHFVSNPDLPKRIQEGLPLNPYNRDTFYTFDAAGYTDYPIYEQLVTS